MKHLTRAEAKALFAAPVKRHKYGARKVVLDGITFDSLLEADRWATLRAAEKAGMISNLRRQVTFELVPGVKLLGEDRARPPIRMVADFVYTQNGVNIIEDTKGMDTPQARLKRHLMKALKGLDVVVVRRGE